MACHYLAGAKYARITQVDACGRPFGNAIIDDCWPTLEVSAQVEEGEDKTWTDARGSTCFTIPGCPSSGGDQLTWTFNRASPELFSIITGATLRLNDVGEPIGIQECEARCNEGFAFETWVEVATEQGCDPTEPGGEGAWYYFLWPWVTSTRLGDYTIGGTEGITFSIVGRSRAGSTWGVGPWDDIHLYDDGTEGPLFQPIDPSCDKPVIEVTALAPPDSPVCELIEVPVESPS